MAVFTPLSQSDIAEFITRYSLGSYLSHKATVGGTQNTNYYVDTAKGNFVLTIFEQDNVTDLPFFVQSMQTLANHSIPCPRPMVDQSGQLTSLMHGKPATLVTRLPGRATHQPNKDDCTIIGGFLGHMHTKAGIIKDIRPNSLSRNEWHQLAKDLTNRGLGKDDQQWIKDSLRLVDQYWPKSLGKGFIHADIFPDNVFFQDRSVSGLIDFYYACSDYFAYDLAIVLNAWCFDPYQQLDISRARSLIQAYQAIRPLPRTEWDALPILGLGASLRFLLTRWRDWIDTPQAQDFSRKDPLEYQIIGQFYRDIIEGKIDIIKELN